MDILAREPPPLPAALAALPLWDVPPFGPLALGADVAKAFGVGASAVRKMRAGGHFPQPAYKTPNASYYRLADLVAPYARKFPGLMLDPSPPVTDPVPSRYEPSHPVTEGGKGRCDASPPVTEAVLSRYDPQEARAELVAVVTEAVSLLIERAPESPAVIETLAAELTAQRAEIGRLQSEIGRLRAEVAGLGVELVAAREALRVESAWRERPLLERLLKGTKTPSAT